MHKNTKEQKMNNELEILNKLCEIYKLDKKDGFVDTYIDEIKLFKVSNNEQLSPLFYNKGFSFIAQERKIGYVSNDSFEKGDANYLIICSPQVNDCETFIIGDDGLFGIYINLNTNRLNRIVKKFLNLDTITKINNKISYTVTCNNRTEVIQNIYLKLLNILGNKTEAEMMSDGLLDELYFRILQSPNGYMLEQLCQQNSVLSRISSVTEHILNRIDIEEILISRGVVDALDHASPKFAVGGKLGIDCTGPEVDELGITLLRDVELLAKMKNITSEVTALKQYYTNTKNPITIIKVQKSRSQKHLFEDLKPVLNHIKILIIVDDAKNDLDNKYMLIWRVVNNIDSNRDLYFDGNTIGVDATNKNKLDNFNRRWPDDVDCTKDVLISLKDRGIIELDEAFEKEFQL